ncbi:MAG: hypothetical protein JWO13_3773 [Acidobacteriales bacterium]|nr:hypothetical protein [Terriglobales bacterium]
MMGTTLRIPRQIWLEMLADQRREHSFAAERVGFLAARVAQCGTDKILLLAFEYRAVSEHDYIDDSTVGARINSNAIRAGMQMAMDLNASIFHVHQHPFRGIPSPSSTDRREYAKMIPPLCNVRPHIPHGALITSLDAASAMTWNSPAKMLQPIEAVSVIGTKIEKFRGQL